MRTNDLSWKDDRKLNVLMTNSQYGVSWVSEQEVPSRTETDAMTEVSEHQEFIAHTKNALEGEVDIFQCTE